MLTSLLTFAGSNLEWQNELIAQFWPAIKKYVEQEVIGVFKEEMPNLLTEKFGKLSFLFSVSLTKLDLGTEAPQLSKITVKNYTRDNEKDLYITMDVDMHLHTDIQISAALASVKVDRVSVHISPFVVQVSNVNPDPPGFSHVSVYMVNKPDIQLHANGAVGWLINEGAEDGLVASARTKIMDFAQAEIAQVMVSPHVLDFSVDMTKFPVTHTFRHKAPSGVFLLTSIRAKKFPQLDLITESDLYVVASLGDHVWKSKSRTNNVTPAWAGAPQMFGAIEDLSHATLVLQFYDDDTGMPDDFAGKLSIPVADVRSKETWYSLTSGHKGEVAISGCLVALTQNMDAITGEDSQAGFIRITPLSINAPEDGGWTSTKKHISVAFLLIDGKDPIVQTVDETELASSAPLVWPICNLAKYAVVITLKIDGVTKKEVSNSLKDFLDAKKMSMTINAEADGASIGVDLDLYVRQFEEGAVLPDEEEVIKRDKSCCGMCCPHERGDSPPKGKEKKNASS